MLLEHNVLRIETSKVANIANLSEGWQPWQPCEPERGNSFPALSHGLLNHYIKIGFPSFRRKTANWPACII